MNPQGGKRAARMSDRCVSGGTKREEEESLVFTEPLGCENDGNMRSGGAHYRGPSHSANEMPRPSPT